MLRRGPTSHPRSSQPPLRHDDPPEISKREHLVRVSHQRSGVQRSNKLAVDQGQALLCRPTGDCASLSDVERYPAIFELGKQLAHWWHAHALHLSIVI